jgi:hypothetical protein
MGPTLKKHPLKYSIFSKKVSDFYFLAYFKTVKPVSDEFFPYLKYFQKFLLG